ncbi:MAG: prephenate dehydrogenase [Lentisphaeria bacterium]|nr:prephenate dehydrogenase [Lentisphaeria bacterium]
MSFPVDKSVAVIGLGLLGASLGLALEKSGVHRLGWARKSETRHWCIAHNVIDETFDDVADVLKQADITVLCLPIPVISQFIREHAPDFKKGSIVTDIGSDKGGIVSAGESALAPYGVYFVGSHPMAGTEKNGCQAAFAELYDNAEVFVTVTGTANDAAVDMVEDFWKLLNIARVQRIDPELHDDLVAHTSHISHLLALALTLSVLDCSSKAEEALRYTGCATGFRDTSRIVSSSPVMWREIIENNQPAVVAAARKCEKIYHEIVSSIEDGDFDRFEELFARGKVLRDNWMAYKQEQKAQLKPEH